MQAIFGAAIALACLSTLGSDARAQERFTQNLVACINWQEVDGNLSVRNVCERLVTVQFMTLDDKYRMIRTLERNQQIETRFEMKIVREIGWIASACPAGFKPTIGLTITNRQKFIDNSYDCVRS